MKTTIKSLVQDKKIKNTVSQGEWQMLMKGLVKVEKRMRVAVIPRGEGVKVKSLKKVSEIEGTKDVTGKEDRMFVKTPNEVEKKDSTMVRVESYPWMTRWVEG